METLDITTVESSPTGEPTVLCSAGGVWLGIPATLVREVCDWETPVPLPLVPPHITGVVNIRGSAVPLLSVVRFLGFHSEVIPRRIVVVSAADMTVGLEMDAVSRVVDDAVWHAPETIGGDEAFRELVRAELHTAQGIAAVVDVPQLLEASKVQ